MAGGTAPGKQQAPGKGEKGLTMNDFLCFKRMITPVIIQILFWIGVVVCVILGLTAIVGGANASRGGGAMILGGLFWILLGPIVVRIYCELLIVIFTINDTLTDVRNLLKPKNEWPAEH